MRALASTLVLALAACGGSGNSSIDVANGASADRSASSSRGEGGTADAESINCNGIPAPDGLDVVGVSMGMSADDAHRAIACSNRALRVSFTDRGGFGLPPLADGQRPRTAIIGESGQERITVGLIGLPGQERVVTIRRTLNFARGQEPAVAAMISELQQKYGGLEHNPDQYGAWSGRALRDASNQPLISVGPSGTLLASQCEMGVLQGNLIGECGLSIAVDIDFSRENQQLASRLVVSMSNGAFGMQQLQAYQAQARGAAEQRQSQEVQDAQGRTPSL
jgi:hypothetical protein